MSRYTDYEIKVQPLPVEDPSLPREYYWHLFFKGRKINGGLCGDPSDARIRASEYRNDHNRQMWLMNNIWDEENECWESYGEMIM